MVVVVFHYGVHTMKVGLRYLHKIYTYVVHKSKVLCLRYFHLFLIIYVVLFIKAERMKEALKSGLSFPYC